MPQRLEKPILQSYTPGTPGQPGFPGQAYQPERRVWESYEVCSYVPYTPYEIEQILLAQGWRYETLGPPSYRRILVPATGAGAGVQIPTGRYTCRTESRLVIIPAVPYIAPRPAVPGTPGTTSRDFQLGWNARARSIRAMAASGRFSFQIPSTVVAAVVGLTPSPRNTGFNDIRWAFRVTAGVLSILEDGIEVQSIGLHNSSDVLAIQRSLGEITYSVAGAVVRTVPNDSSPMYLSAALYSGGDAVYEAALLEFSDGVGDETMSPIQAFGGTEAYAIAVGLMEPMLAFGGAYGTGFADAAMEPIVAYGAGPGGYAIGTETMEPMTAEGEAIEELTYALASELMQPIIVAANGLTGTVGGADELMEPIAVSAAATAELYGQAIALIAPMTAYGENYGLDTEATMFSIIAVGQDATPLQTLAVVMNSSMEVVGVVTAQVVLPQAMISSLTIAQTMQLQQELEALIQSTMSAYAVAGDGAASLEAWATNLGILGSTRYTNFGFNSMAKLGTKYYGANENGLFVLNGNDDDGEDIDAEINFGNLNFGTSARKKLPYCYVGAASDGRMVLKVEAEGQTYYYDVRNHSQEMAMQRFEPGKGLRAVYYDLTLLNKGGSLFDLDSIEFFPVPLTRRL